MRHFLVIILFTGILISCSPVEYKRADLSTYAGLHGYLDKEISPGVHIIEVTQRGGYQFINDYDGTISVLNSHWKQRAGELCPNGYIGKSSVIDAYQAKIEEFRCDLRFCQRYPVISGEIKCQN